MAVVVVLARVARGSERSPGDLSGHKEVGGNPESGGRQKSIGHGT
jgi:hypothetical protein